MQEKKNPFPLLGVCHGRLVPRDQRRVQRVPWSGAVRSLRLQPPDRHDRGHGRGHRGRPHHLHLPHVPDDEPRSQVTPVQRSARLRVRSARQYHDRVSI